MSKETKDIVDYDESFAKLDIRVGRVVDVESETGTHEPIYKMVVDFGKHGKRVGYGSIMISDKRRSNVSPSFFTRSKQVQGESASNTANPRFLSASTTAKLSPATVKAPARYRRCDSPPARDQ
jgi:hypothetical protein